jgi:phage/plasmid-associated DNA primase
VAQVVESERDGILALLVWGCRAAMADSGDGRAQILAPPLDVEAKTDEWKATQDTVALWLADKTISANGASPAVEGRHCLNDYRDWCKRQDPVLPALGRNNFYESLAMQPGLSRTGDANHVWFWGVLLRTTPLD